MEQSNQKNLKTKTQQQEFIQFSQYAHSGNGQIININTSVLFIRAQWRQLGSNQRRYTVHCNMENIKTLLLQGSNEEKFYVRLNKLKTHLIKQLSTQRMASIKCEIQLIKYKHNTSYYQLLHINQIVTDRKSNINTVASEQMTTSNFI